MTELAVRNRLPPYANEDDMYAALDRCGMSVSEIFDELDRRVPSGQPDGVMVHVIQRMLFERFDQRLLEETAHKVPL